MSSLVRVLQGAGLVAKHVAQHLTEQAYFGAAVVPVRWEGAARTSGRSAASKEQSSPDPQSPGGTAPQEGFSPEPPVHPSSTEKRASAHASSSFTTPAADDAPPLPLHRPLPAEPSPSGSVAEEHESGVVDAPMKATINAVGKQSIDAKPSAAVDQRSSRAVPTHAITRAVHFGGLGLGLAAGAAAAAVRRAVGQPDAGAGSAYTSEANVERLAATLCRLRGAALKVGQMLSFNDADVLPPALRVAMERVRDGADWMPAHQLEETMRSELGDGWREQLLSFEEVPIASASIGQVHRAVLGDGRHVAVKVQYPGVAESIQSDLWSMKQLITYTGLVPSGLFLDRVLEVAQRELLQECDYVNEAAATTRFKMTLAPYPEFAVPAVVPSLSSQRVLTTEWMPGIPIDRAAKQAMSTEERDRVGSRLLWLSLAELFTFRFMQTDPNWSNFLYEPRTGQLSLIDFGACQQYDPQFVDEYLRMVMACAEGAEAREAILEHSHRLRFLTGEENKTMLDAHVNAAVLVGLPFSASAQPYDFGKQDISKRIAADVSTMIKHRLTPPREEIYTLHRRLNGCFQLAARVGARISARDILHGLYAEHEWHSNN